MSSSLHWSKTGHLEIIPAYVFLKTREQLDPVTVRRRCLQLQHTRGHKWTENTLEDVYKFTLCCWTLVLNHPSESYFRESSLYFGETSASIR